MKTLKRITLAILLILLIAIGYMVVNFLPIMSGMVSKTMCSCVFVMGRDPQSVVERELSVFPGLSSASVVINPDSTVTASMLGSETRAIYRKGLGCTLLAQRPETEVRKQVINLATQPFFKQDTIPWPSGDLMSPTHIPGVDYQQIQNAVDSAFVDVDPAKPIYTLGVVVLYDGQIVGEKYAPGITMDSKLMGWSMTKSIVSAMIGILVKDGKLTVEQKAPVAEWQNDERKEITLNNLLQGSSGLDWSETYFLPGDFHNMFIHSDDKGGYAASKKSKYKPNEHFQYSSGTSNLLSKIVRQTVGGDNYYRFPYERLFYKIGMRHTLLEPDASGTFVGSSYGFASARDWARFGLLYLNNGNWLGEQILPENWVTYSATPAPAAPRQEYGAQWWLNAGEKGNPVNCFFPGLPNEAIVAEGFEKQSVVIVPSKKLVVVRLGITHNRNFHLDNLVNGVIKGLPK